MQKIKGSTFVSSCKVKLNDNEIDMLGKMKGFFLFLMKKIFVKDELVKMKLHDENK